MQIRRATNKDIPEITRLLNQVNLVHHKIRPDLFNIGRKYTKKQLEEIVRDDQKPIFAALEDDDRTMFGYCMTWVEQIRKDTIRTEVKTLYIDDLCVDESARGKGVGQKLYAFAREYAKENDCYNITLHVWEGNDIAAGFYRAMGLKPQYTCLEQIIG